MMTILQLLSRLREQRVRLWAEGDRIRFSAPPGALTDELRAGLADRKPEILALLRGGPLGSQSPGPSRAEGDAGPFPLSFAQQRLWLLQQLDPESTEYNIVRALRLTGPLRVDLLERSLAEVIRRHEILRTTFEVRDGEPVQKVTPWDPDVAWSLPWVDLQALPMAARRREAERLARWVGDLPFDLARGPLLRVVLIRLADGENAEHVAGTAMHHIVGDALSTGILFREMGVVYDALAAGRPAALPELPLQYADFARWQRRHLTGEVLEEHLAYWRQRLDGAPEALELPADHPRTTVSNRGGRFASTLPAPLVERLRALAQAEGATLFMGMLAGFDALLQRWSGQDDLVVGFPVGSRGRTEVEGLIGIFVNLLALRVSVAGDPGLREILSRVRQATVEAFAHQDLPFEKLVEELRPDRQLSRAPVFQISFGFQNVDSPARLSSFGMSLLPSVEEPEAFDLSCGTSEAPEGIQISWRYKADLFETPTIARLATHFETLLEGAVADPDRPLSELPLLGPAERHQVVAEWSTPGDAAEVPRPRAVHEIFEEVARESADAVALEDADLQVTYAELNRRANRLARHLAGMGVGPDVTVGLCMERSPALVEGMLGVLKTGAAYVPLDPTYPHERLAYLVDDAALPVWVTRGEAGETLAPLARRGAAAIDVDLDGPWIASQESGDLGVPVDPDALAYVMYTSGSTGRPKGVEVPHRAVARLVRGDFIPFGPREVFLHLAPPSFDASTLEVWGPLLHGGRLVVAPPGPLSIAALEETLARHRVSTLWLTAGLFHQVVEERVEALRPVRHLLAGGDVLSPPHVRRALADRPGRVLVNGYGPTENTTFTCCHRMYGAADVWEPVPIGRPIAGTRVHLLDRAFRPVPAGIPGELWTGGDGLARGYRWRPDLTAERFVPDPLGVGERLYRTGDLARFLPDGRVEFLGRLDRQVKIRGFRIEPAEIEAALAEHGTVREAAVIPRGDLPGGKGLVAYVVAAEGREARSDELRRFLADQLPEYMVPGHFVELPELPLDANGKVDRRRLAEGPSPVAAASEEGGERGPANWRTPVEEVLGGLWAELFGLPEAGPRDDFFELGGHSLLAVRLLSRVRQVFGADVPLRDLFERPRLEDFARCVEETALRSGATLPPLGPADRSGPLPLSFAQERLWFLDQLGPATPLYNIPVALRIAGALDAAALGSALGEIVRRHEVLRTRYSAIEGRPVQVVAPEVELPLVRVDLSALPSESRDAELRRLAVEEGRRPFDLARGPVLRAALVRLDEEDHAVLLSLHHIASDGWSMGLLVGEVSALYDAFRHGRPSPLPELPVQYADYAAWQRGWLDGPALASLLDHWRGRLAGAPPLLELPTDRPRPPFQSFRGSTRRFLLPSHLAAELSGVARRESATLFMVLLAGFAALLRRITGQDDLVVGTATANRGHAATEGLIGFFVNNLPLRVDAAGDPGWNALLARVRETTLAAYAHQEMPFARLVEELSPERSLAHTPLFQVALVLQNLPVRAAGLPGLSLVPVPVDTGTAKHDWMLTFGEEGDGLAGTFEYAAELFDAPTIERCLGAFERLLGEVAADPGRRISGLDLLSPGERAQVVHEWNDTAPAHPPAAAEAAHVVFARQVRNDPAAPALRSRGLVWSYGELDARAERLAGHLRRLGAGPESLVAVCLRRSPAAMAAVLGVLRAGAAFLPMDPDDPAERLGLVLADSGASLLLTEAGLAGALPAHAARTLLVEEMLETPAGPVPLESPDPLHLAYVIYTSGSTGRPKGVAVTHGGLANMVRAQVGLFGVEAVDRVLQFAAASFDASVSEIFMALTSGACLALEEREALLPGPGLAAWLEAEGISVLTLTPPALAVLPPLVAGGLPALRTLIVAGEACPPELADRWAVGRRLWNAYGPTEGTVCATAALHRPGTGRLPIGRPIAGVRVHLLEGGGEPVPVGVTGELALGGAGVARGYLGRPGLTAERFVPDPFGGPGARLYRTGDLGRLLPTGEIEYLGRRDAQVKIRGHRVELGEVEAVLAAHPAVREAAVVVREDGPAGRRLAACVTAAMPSPVLRQELRSHLEARLPSSMVPAEIAVLPGLPTTSAGKVDRRALADLLRGGAGAAGEAGDGGHRPPADPVEELVAGIFAEVLGRDRVGAEGHFFDLGGHSLMATQVMSRVEAVLQVELPLQVLFEAPTVAGLAARIAAAGPGRRRPPAIERLPRPQGGGMPLSFGQQRLWLIDQLDPGSTAYNLPAGVRLEGELDVPALAATLDEIVRRHEVLRSVFREAAGEPVQVALPPAPVPLPVADLSALPPAARRREVQRLAQSEAERSFDLSRGPLLRALLAVLDPADHAVLLTLHHIVSDGWSTGILVHELGVLYAAFSRGERSPLPEPEIQYADFAAWQRSWLTGEVLAAEIDYWRGRLAGAPPALDLPADRPRPPVQTQRGAAVTFAVPAELMRDLRSLARRQGTTLFMTLLAAFQTLLARVTGQFDVNVGTLVAGRNQLRTEGLLGFFINTLVLRSDLSGEPPFSGLLAHVREVTLEAFAHQDLPFERLVEELQPARDLSRTPLFQVLFSLQNAPVGPLEVPGMRLEPLLAERRTALFDLALTLEEGGIGSAEYSTDLFAHATIERLMGNLVALLEGAVAAPGSAVGDLPLLRAFERHQIVREWNDTARVWPRHLRLHDLIVEQARRAPDAVALVHGGEHLTYGDLLRRSDRLARSLRALGAGPEVTVALCLERSLEMGVALLGSLLAGATWVPLEPTYPPERLAFMLEDSGAVVLLTQERLLASLPSGGFQVICLDHVTANVGEGLAPSREGASPSPTENEKAAGQLDLSVPESAVYVIYTSGSTGRPKGVMVPHDALVSYALDVVRFCSLGPADRVLQFAPLGFDVIVEEVFPCWVSGGAVVLEDPDRLLSPLQLHRTIEEAGVTWMELPAAYWHEWVHELETGQARLPSTLRLLIVGSEKPSAERLAFWQRFGVELIYIFGLTETTITSCFHRLPSAAGPAGLDLPVGRPIANTSLYVLDGALEPLPAGVPGELFVGGAGVARGYLGRPDLTAERFVPDPFAAEPGARLYRTGDRARLRPDGPVDFLGRLDHQIKIRGFRVEPGEVESRLGEHPGVREVLVTVREDRPGDKRLVAYLVATPVDGTAEPAGAGELRGFLREAMPDYMVPSAFVFLDALPLTPNGKVDRRRLPVPVDQRPDTLPFIAPRNAAEEVLARIWSELLGRDRIGVFDDFFELGGHSLLAARTTARLRSVFGMELPLRALFESPTVAGLGEALDRAAGEPGIVEQIAEVYLEVEGFSEDEMRAILSES